MTDDMKQTYWETLPIDKINAATYRELTVAWNTTGRQVRKILQELSAFDNGDDYILIRSAKHGGGFYRTQNKIEIQEYKKECLNKGKSLFAPVKKINRVLNSNITQLTFNNNLRLYRENAGLKQLDVCDRMKQYDPFFDVPLLSKMENGVCLPTYEQCDRLAQIYDCRPADLIRYDLFIN